MASSTPAKTSKDNSVKQAGGPQQESVRPFSPSGGPASILKLHHLAGNQAVNQLLQLGSGILEFEPDGALPIVQAALNSGGQPLDPSNRAFMESRFDHDFGQVRVHMNTEAAQSTTLLRAKAYTVGSDIVFGKGRYQPNTLSGKRLLAHELAHVIQQSRGGTSPTLDSDIPYERSAQRAATSVVAGQSPINIAGSTGVGLAREEDPEIEKVLEPLKGEKEPVHPALPGKEKALTTQLEAPEPMNDDEKAYVKDVCMFFYPSNPPAEVNDKLADLGGRMLYAAMEKSKALNLVPRPPLGRPGTVWLLLQAVKIFWRSQGKVRIYKAARDAVAYQHKTEYELARLGL